MQPSVASRVLVLEIQFPDRIFNTCVSANSDFLRKPPQSETPGVGSARGPVFICSRTFYVL